MYLDLINATSALSHKLFEMANKNLGELEGKFQEPEEVQDYYLGMLRRQAMLCFDLHIILKDRPAENLTTPYILLRMLLDDFLHVTFLELCDDKLEYIIRINADGHKDNFSSLKNLSASKNQEYFNENLGYLTEDEFEKLKKDFISKDSNHKYFEDIVKFKFKSSLTLTNLANSINGHVDVNVARDRAFYMWKTFSSFVHYSNWCYNYELTKDIVNIQMMTESLQYTFNTIYMCSYYFKQTKSTKCFVDNYILNELNFPLFARLKKP